MFSQTCLWFIGLSVSYLMVFYFTIAANTHECPIKIEYLYSGAFQITGAISTLEFTAERWEIKELYFIHSVKYRWLKNALTGYLLAYFYAAVLLSFPYFALCFKKLSWWVLVVDVIVSCISGYLAYLNILDFLDRLDTLKYTESTGRVNRIEVINHSFLRLEVLLRGPPLKKTYLSLHEVCKLRPDISPKYLYLRILKGFLVFPESLAVKLKSLKCEGCDGFLELPAILSLCRCTRPFHYACYKRYIAGHASCEYCRQLINQELVNKAHLYIRNSLKN